MQQKCHLAGDQDQSAHQNKILLDDCVSYYILQYVRNEGPSFSWGLSPHEMRKICIECFMKKRDHSDNSGHPLPEGMEVYIWFEDFCTKCDSYKTEIKSLC